jgi:hypothetical protein
MAGSIQPGEVKYRVVGGPSDDEVLGMYVLFGALFAAAGVVYLATHRKCPSCRRWRSRFGRSLCPTCGAPHDCA